MKILVVGGGAREHALVWKLRRDRPDLDIIVAPGNKAIARLAHVRPVDLADTAGLVDLAKQERVDLTIVGPEAPLVAGISDEFALSGLRLFGPSKAAAMIEGSKCWAKGFMRRHGIPCASSQEFQDLRAAEEYIRTLRLAPVVKYDGLANGKGVTVSRTLEEAVAACRDVFHTRGDPRVVIEERLEGWELSISAFCDGRTVALMPASCDYKPLCDHDKGPNTGGMGAYAPAIIEGQLWESIRTDIILPTLHGLAEEGRPFVGVLYPGLMITSDGPKVLEFNCRLGSPEAESLLPLLASDLVEIVSACVEGHLDRCNIRWSEEHCCAVVLAAPGYPNKIAPADPVGWDDPGEALAFLGAGSGRLLTVCGVGPNLQSARDRAYAGVGRIEITGGQFRRDIAAHDRTTSTILNRALMRA